MSSPYPSKLPSELYTLGDVQAEYRSDNLFLMGLLGAGVCLVAGALLVGLFYATGITSRLWTVVIPIAFIGSLFIVVKGLIEGRKVVLVLTDGIAEIKRGKVTTMRWDEITSVNQKVSASRYGKSTSGTPNFTYTVTSLKGKLAFRDYNGIEQLGATIQYEVSKRLGPKMADAFDRGETLNFGKVSVNKSGLDYGKGMIPWSEVEQVSMSLGKLNVRRNGRWIETGQTAGQTPNLNLMMSIASQVINKVKK